MRDRRMWSLLGVAGDGLLIITGGTAIFLVGVAFAYVVT